MLIEVLLEVDWRGLKTLGPKLTKMHVGNLFLVFLIG